MFGKKKKNKGSIQVSALIGAELYEKAVDLSLGWSDSLRKGVSISLKENEWGCNFHEKLRKMTEKLAEIAQEKNELELKNYKLIEENAQLLAKISDFQTKIGVLRLK